MDTPIISTVYDGKPRRVFPKNCKQCDGIFYRPKHCFKRTVYCSNECKYIACKRQVDLICPQCTKPFTVQLKRTKASMNFCSRVCKDEAQKFDGIFQQKHVNDGHSSYRTRALRELGAVCCKCSYDKSEKMLDADHIDGDRQNSKISNLQVLCVWCHALKTRGVPDHDRAVSTIG